MSMGTDVLHRPKAWARAPGTLRGVAAVMVAGGIAGMVVGGVGSRVAMRVLALAAPEQTQGLLTEAGARVGEITLEGTVFLVLFAGVGSAMFGTALYLAALPWLPRRRSLRAVAFGGLELAVFGAFLFDPDNPDFAILGRPVLSVVVFGALFVIHGAALVMLVEPGAKLVQRVVGSAVWRARLVDGATVVGLGLTAVSAIGLAGRGGAMALATLTLVATGAGLALIEPGRARPVTRPGLWAVGGLALTILTVRGTLDLLDAVTTIV